MSRFSVLFVCTANICRTPMAEIYLRKLVVDENLQEQIEVKSAGTWAIQGVPPAENSIQVCSENGLEALELRSKPVNPTMMNQCNLVLCMTTEHKNDLLAIFPHHNVKLFTLKEFCRPEPPEQLSIKDPHGRSMDIHRNTFWEIKAEIDRMWPQIKQRSTEAV